MESKLARAKNRPDKIDTELFKNTLECELFHIKKLSR